MSHWTLESIPWEKFDRTAARPDLISLAKAACMVEYNGRDYARYLCEVFAGDDEFQAVAKTWAEEEVQHGQALRKWAELADPTFDFDKSFKRFTDGYKLPTDVKASVRGSRTGELIARCVVETGTSSYYTAIKENTDEPVLQAICANIAADEFRHYKLFYNHLKRYALKENIGKLKRFSIALSRIAESEDDELTYAFFAADDKTGTAVYDRELYSKRYIACAYAVYRKWHIEKMTRMIFKAIGMTPPDFLNKAVDSIAWMLMKRRTERLGHYKQQVLAAA